jgi:hypothetical protein
MRNKGALASTCHSHQGDENVRRAGLEWDLKRLLKCPSRGWSIHEHFRITVMSLNHAERSVEIK